MIGILITYYSERGALVVSDLVGTLRFLEALYEQRRDA